MPKINPRKFSPGPGSGKEKVQRIQGQVHRHDRHPKRTLVIVASLALGGFVGYEKLFDSGSSNGHGSTKPTPAHSGAPTTPGSTVEGCRLTVHDKRHGGPANVLEAMHRVDLPRDIVPGTRVNDHLWIRPGVLQVQIGLGPNHQPGAKPDINLVNPHDTIELAPVTKPICDAAHGQFLGQIARHY